MAHSERSKQKQIDEDEGMPCRICLGFSDKMFDIFKTVIQLEVKPDALYKAVQEATGIPVSRDDAYPKLLCLMCVGRVKASCFLRQQAQDSIQAFSDAHRIEENEDNSCETETAGTDDYSGVKIEILDWQQAQQEEDETEEEVVESENVIVDESMTASSVAAETNAVEFLLDMPIPNNTDEDELNEIFPKPISTASQVRRHECQVCNKKFLRKSNLVDHLRLHANVKLYKCDYCDKAFVQSGNYKAHIRTHTNERPFACDLCSKSYSQSSALKIHKRSHTNERNYICDTCGKGFTNSSDLGKHRRVHDPNAKIKCQHCAKTFAQKANYRLHMMNNHADKLISSTDSPKT